MSDGQFVAFAAFLAWIGFQVWSIRRDQRAYHVGSLERQELKELDDELRRHCPNVFDTLTRNDLREWQAVRLRKLDFFEERKDTLLNPHSFEPSSWVDFYSMLAGLASKTEDSDVPFPPSASDEERVFLRACRAATEAFVSNAAERTSLTSSEIGFLTYRQWSETFFREGDWQRPFAFHADHFERSFETLLETYATRAAPGVVAQG